MGEKLPSCVFMYLSSPLAHHFRFSDVLFTTVSVTCNVYLSLNFFIIFDMTKRLGMINEKLLPSFQYFQYLNENDIVIKYASQ